MATFTSSLLAESERGGLVWMRMGEDGRQPRPPPSWRDLRALGGFALPPPGPNIWVPSIPPQKAVGSAGPTGRRSPSKSGSAAYPELAVRARGVPPPPHQLAATCTEGFGQSERRRQPKCLSVSPIPLREAFRDAAATTPQLPESRPATGVRVPDVTRPKTTCSSATAPGTRRQPMPRRQQAQPQPAALGGAWAVALARSGDRDVDEAPGGRTIGLLRSVFMGRPPVLLFDTEAYPRDGGRRMRADELQEQGFRGLPRMYFVMETNRDVHEYHAVVNTLVRGGLVRADLDVGRCAVYWGPHPPPEMLRALHPFQKANHFPQSWQLGRKDLLWKNVHRMRRQWPRHYEIMPAGFVMPDDHSAWLAAREQSPGACWIWKPVSLSCGRGIKIYTSALDAAVDRRLSQKQGVVQRYVDKPLLIEGFKFDLRIYVVVTSFDPLKVYVNSEGLVRIATEKYSLSPGTLAKRTMHLTNYSVNKHAETYKVQSLERRASGGSNASLAAASAPCSPEPAGEAAEAEDSGNEEGDGPSVPDSPGQPSADRPPGRAQDGPAAGGSSGERQMAFKWSLSQLQEHFAKCGLDYRLMMDRIHDVIIKALLSAEPTIVSTLHQGATFAACVGTSAPQVGPNQSCFEIFGFDILVDEQLQPLLLEVNNFPSLSSSSPLDKRIKTRLVADSLTLVGLYPFDHEVVGASLREDQARRLHGLAPRSGVTRSHTVQTVGCAPLADLGEAEWQLILDTHDEYMRRGGLERIFPTAQTAAQYSQFFSVPRYANLVLARWLEAGGERVFQPAGRAKIPPWVPQQVCTEPC